MRAIDGSERYKLITYGKITFGLFCFDCAQKDVRKLYSFFRLLRVNLHATEAKFLIEAVLRARARIRTIIAEESFNKLMYFILLP